MARLVAIDKTFGALPAVDGVSIEFHAGEVHALLGENGAGKTTLMKILAGLLRPDAGVIEIRDSPVKLRDRRSGSRHGVGMVQQHSGLVEELTGIENLVLSNPHGRFVTNPGRAAREIKRLAGELKLPVDASRRVGELTIGERQRLEILIALSSQPEVLIMDEPTAALGVADADTLARVVRRIAEEGSAVVYVTHKLREVMEVSDRVTVMRRGRVVESRETADTSVDELAEALIGSIPAIGTQPNGHEVGEPVLALRRVSVSSRRGFRGLDAIELTVCRGELVGVAGVIGNGQEALAALLAGQIEPDSGTIEPRPARIGYVPEDRGREGLASALSVADNSIVHRHRDPSISRHGYLHKASIRKFVTGLVTAAQVWLPTIESRAKTLSGGNQQKLVVARELDQAPDLIVAHNPYRGLDVGAAFDVRNHLLKARSEGAGVVIISADLDDFVDLADRLAVLFEGRFVGIVDPRRTTVQELGKLMAGIAPT